MARTCRHRGGTDDCPLTCLIFHGERLTTGPLGECTPLEESKADISAAGWCAPNPGLLYDPASLGDVVLAEVVTSGTGSLFPKISVPRGGIRFEPPTRAERLAQDALASQLRRMVDELMSRRNEVVDRATVVALANGWDIHVHEPPDVTTWDLEHNRAEVHYLAYVGIEFTPAKHPLPTIHYHSSPDRDIYDWDD